jgi:hypothetical protein
MSSTTRLSHPRSRRSRSGVRLSGTLLPNEAGGEGRSAWEGGGTVQTVVVVWSGTPLAIAEHLQRLLNQDQATTNTSIQHYEAILRSIYDTTPLLSPTARSSCHSPLHISVRKSRAQGTASPSPTSRNKTLPPSRRAFWRPRRLRLANTAGRCLAPFGVLVRSQPKI